MKTADMNGYALDDEYGLAKKYIKKRNSTIHLGEHLRTSPLKASASAAMISTIPTTSKADDANKLRKENIKSKVAYEWK